MVDYTHHPRIDSSEWVAVTADVSEEELERRSQGTEWYTSAQVLEHLSKLVAAEREMR